MTEPITDDRIAGLRKWAERLANGECNGCRIAAQGLADLLGEVGRLKTELDEAIEAVGLAQWAFKYSASSLHATGFNERHAMDCPNQTDEAGITASEWRAHYKKAMADVSKARDKAKAVLNHHHGLPAASDQ